MRFQGVVSDGFRICKKGQKLTTSLACAQCHNVLLLLPIPQNLLECMWLKRKLHTIWCYLICMHWPPKKQKTPFAQYAPKWSKIAQRIAFRFWHLISALFIQGAGKQVRVGSLKWISIFPLLHKHLPRSPRSTIEVALLALALTNSQAPSSFLKRWVKSTVRPRPDREMFIPNKGFSMVQWPTLANWSGKGWKKVQLWGHCDVTQLSKIPKTINE